MATEVPGGAAGTTAGVASPGVAAPEVAPGVAAGVAAPAADPAPRNRARGGRRARVVPISTYRLQLQPGFGFAEAAAVAPYLARLGVSHVYSSPYLQAASGSVHGYDVVDPRHVNVELGGARGHRRFGSVLGELGLGQVLDIVPNHMAIPATQNPWWWDVLENGQASRYARTFDVDWEPPEAHLRNVILLPILGDHYGRVLEAGEIKLERKGAGTDFRVCYYEHELPVALPSLAGLLAEAAARIRSAELGFIADSIRRLGTEAVEGRGGPPERPAAMRRQRDREVARRLLGRLLAEDEHVARAVNELIAETNRNPDALDAILSEQNYRLAYWRAADRDLGYRRFFDVSGLIGIRVEDEQVFTDTHQLILRWLAAGSLDGIRVDHPDGLRNPLEYLRRLRAGTPRGWIVVEKILSPGERLRPEWPVDGTTGYDFLNLVGGLFVDPAGEAPLTRLNERMTGEARPFRDVSRECRLLVLHETLGSELNRLTALFLEICERHRRYRDFTRHELHEALREVAASMPVYRTYVTDGRPNSRPSPEDVAAIDQATETAAAARPDLDPELFGFLRDILELRVRGTLETDLLMRFQQLTGAVTAKGVEDTAFYRYLRLTSLNEVGGDPARFGVSIADFHAANAERLERYPASMLTTMTHDAKRGEDVRLRISALSEIPERWAAAVERWHGFVVRHSRGAHIDGSTEHLIFQTLVGAWPISRDRLTAYVTKAGREAKGATSWTSPNQSFEDQMARMIGRLLRDREFVADLEAFLAPVVAAARVSSLAQTLFRLTSPGVPDTYQGSELWDLRLVDPDNRSPVDFGLRERLLAELDAGLAPEEIARRMDEGLPKLWVTHRTLDLRRRRPELFDARGGYEPLQASGARAGNVVAFVRGGRAIAIAPRLVLGLRGRDVEGDSAVELARESETPPAVDWGTTTLTLPDGEWRDELTGDTHFAGRVQLSRLLGRFPVALLVR